MGAYRVVGPNVPFGGFGASGIGRENGSDVLREYTETRSIWIENLGRDPRSVHARVTPKASPTR